MTETTPGFIKRLAFAAVNLLLPLQTAVILFYFGARWAGRGDIVIVQGFTYILPWLFLPLPLLLPLLWWRRSRLLWALAAVPLLLFVLTYGRLFLPRLPVQTSAPTFTVMTYNVLFRNQQPAHTAATIAQYNPDILALHEYTDALAQQMNPALSAIYPYRQLENGRGLYSRYPITAYEFIPMTGFGGGAQQVIVEIDGRSVTILSVHPAPPPTNAVKVPGMPVYLPTHIADVSHHAAQMDVILDHIQQIDGPLVLVGDLNMTDQHPAYAALMAHLQDAFVERGRGLGFTFTPFAIYELPTWRIDYVLHSPVLTAVDVQIGDFGGSDHKPVLATLALP